MNTNSPVNTLSASAPAPAHFSPRPTVDSEELAQEILLDYQLETAIPMLVLAKRHNITMYALLDFLDDPETQRRIEQIRRLSEQREKLIGYDARCAATQRLESIALREKDVETARKAATTLLRPPAAVRPPKPDAREANSGQNAVPTTETPPLPPALTQSPPPAQPPRSVSADTAHAETVWRPSAARDRAA